MGLLRKKDKKTVKIDPRSINEDKLKEAAELLHEGAFVVFPTETVYGIGVHPSFKKSVDKLYEIKHRSKDKPFALLVANYLYLSEFHILDDTAFSFLTKKFWPGPLTLIIKDKKGKRFGFRMPKDAIALRLIELVGDPILVTSVNLSGEKAAVSVKGIPEQICKESKLVIDGGRAELAESSTVVDLSAKPYRVVRRGANCGEVEEALLRLSKGPVPKRKVLLVCTGNSCRTPMAEGWLKLMASKKGKTEYEFNSCGTIGRDGWSATDEAKAVCVEDGVDISHYSSKTITRRLVVEADEILAMSNEHEQFILQQHPYLLGRIKVLNVADPIGMDTDFYRETYRKIKEKLRIVYPWLKE